MKPWTKYALIATILLALGTLFYNKIYLPKVMYKVAVATVGALHVSVFGIGNVDAKEIYPITAQTGGKVTSILTDEGKWVKKGELLATIDDVELPALMDEAKNVQKKAEFESLGAQDELHNLSVQKALLYATFTRYEKLYAQKFISKAEYDKADTDLKSINAQIASAQTHKSASEMEIKKASNTLQALQLKSSRLKIFSPIDGYVLSKNAQVAQTVLPTQSIVTIVDPKTVWIKAFINEKISSKIVLGQSAKITLRSSSDKEFEGKVVRINPRSDATTQEREIAVAFAKLPIPFYINEQAEVKIQTEVLNNVTLLDEAWVLHESQISGVWVVQDGKAHFMKLTILGTSDGKVACKEAIKNQILVPDTTKKPLSEGMKIHL